MLGSSKPSINLSKPQDFARFLFGAAVGYLTTRMAEKEFDRLVTAIRKRRSK